MKKERAAGWLILVGGMFARSAFGESSAPEDAESTAQTEEQANFALVGGFDYLSGKFGDSSSTTVWSVPLTARYEREDWVFEVTIPYVRVTGPLGVVPGVGEIIATPSPRRTRSGLGDITTTISRTVYRSEEWSTQIGLTGKIKFGTASAAQSLGTGENDYSTAVELVQPLGAFSVTGIFGYAFLGSPPEVHLNNTFFGSIGSDYAIDNRTTAGLALALQERTSALMGGGPQQVFTATLEYKLTDQWVAKGFAARGFSLSSLDWAGGATVSYGF